MQAPTRGFLKRECCRWQGGGEVVDGLRSGTLCVFFACPNFLLGEKSPSRGGPREPQGRRISNCQDSGQ